MKKQPSGRRYPESSRSSVLSHQPVALRPALRPKSTTRDRASLWERSKQQSSAPLKGLAFCAVPAGAAGKSGAVPTYGAGGGVSVPVPVPGCQG